MLHAHRSSGRPCVPVLGASRGLGWLAACGVLCGAAAWAGTAPGGKAVTDQPATPARRFWEWDVSNRRDPFEFKSIEEKASVQQPVTPTIAPVGPTPVPPTPGTGVKATATAQEIRAFAEAKAAEAEAYIGVQQYAKAEEVADEALGKLKGAHADTAVSERLTRARKTAERLRKRSEIEKEFKNITIDIQGIIWEPENPMALIKGQLVKEGDVVEGATIEEINTAEIIFNFRGVRCRRGPGL